MLTRRTSPSIFCVSTSPRRLSRKCTTRVSVTERRLVTHCFCTRSFTTSVNVGGLTRSADAASVILAILLRHYLILDLVSSRLGNDLRLHQLSLPLVGTALAAQSGVDGDFQCLTSADRQGLRHYGPSLYHLFKRETPLREPGSLTSSDSVSYPIKCLRTHTQSCVTLTEGLGAKLFDLTCIAQHLVHLVKVQLFADDHLSCIFFQQDGLSFRDFQEFVIGGDRGLLVLQAFS
jgi:hypothetical protein